MNSIEILSPFFFTITELIFLTGDLAEQDDDLKVENGDVTVVIDPLSLQYLDSAEIDYSADNFSSQFVIRNPNVQATCGCGSSFAV